MSASLIGRFGSSAFRRSTNAVGKAATRSVLKKLRADARRLPKASKRRQDTIELDARINALQ